MRCLSVLAALLLSTAVHAAEAIRIASPNGVIQVTVALDAQGRPTYAVQNGRAEVLRPSRLGLTLATADLSRGLQLDKAEKVETVTDSYTLSTDKRAECRYRANRRVIRFRGGSGPQLSVIFQVSDDGVAFQYLLEGAGPQVQQITAEHTSFRLPAGAQGWLHPHAKAQTGWSNTQPSYEEYYQQGIAAGTASPLGEGWSFPALFRAGGNWLLLTEAGLGRSYCGSHLAHQSPEGEYSLAFPQPAERTTATAPVLPESTLPWRTPWRVIVVGSTLAPLVESTLTTDLSAPAQTPISVAGPGKASWSWVLLGDTNTTYEVQRRFMEYAARMGWRYCLVDALWDKQIGYDKMAELAQYARGKNVELLVWYNSNGSWNQAPQTPSNNVMFEAARRRQEFARIRKMGIAGVKIDFFGGDGQSFINYYHDLLTDATAAGLLVNFHGTTIPRGWNRTFPNLMTMEAVRGFEFLTFDQANTDQEPTHCAVLPFTRNAVGPMDFTPMCFSEIPGKQRRTSNAFELALSVLFQSGIQHYAETDEGMARQPAYVQDFVKNLPPRWTDVRFLDGFPGQYAVLARQAPNGRWYVAGINGTDQPKTLRLDLGKLGGKGGTLILDGATSRSFDTRAVTNQVLSLTLPARGGFVVQPR